MPRIKKATDANGNVFYPITISKGVWDTDNNQRLSQTVSDIKGKIPSSQGTSGQVLTSNGSNSPVWKTGEIIHIATNVTGTSAVTTSPYTSAKWNGTCDGVATLYTGLTVSIKIPVAGDDNYGTTLNINSLGDHPVCINVNTLVGTKYPAGSIITLTYDADQTATIYNDSTIPSSVTGTWKVAEYDSSNIYQLRHNNGSYLTTTASGRYMIMLQKNETSFIPVTAVDNTTATTKTLTTDSFNPFGQIIYYNSETALAANGEITADTIYTQTTLDLRYSFNSAKTLTANKDVYIVAEPQSNGMAKLASDPIAQELPNTADGKIYIYLGHTYSTYQIELYPEHPVYAYIGGKIINYIGVDSKSAENEGTDVSLVTTGEKYTWNNKQDSITFNTAYDASTNKAATMSDITKTNVGLGNVTNDKQIPGLSSGTTENHVITWGTDGYTVKDSGYTIEKSVPSDAVFTDESVTSVSNHYSPTKNDESTKTASGATGTSGTTIQVVTGIEMDAKGHVTGVVSGAATDTTYGDFVGSGSTAASGLVPAPSTIEGTTKYLREDATWATPPDTDRYVNSATFTDDTTTDSSNPVKMTLTRTGSDSGTVVANIPKVSESSAGVVPKGESVSTQSQNTKFLRSDGTWAVPSYIAGSDTTYKLSVNGTVNGDSEHGTDLGTVYAPTTAGTDGQFLVSEGSGAPSWETITIPDAANNAKFNVNTKVGSAEAVTVADFTANQSGADDDITFIQGDNVTLTSDTTNRTITIAATDTTYSSGTKSLLDTGTDTTDRVWPAKEISDYVAGMTTNATLFKDGFDASSTDGTLDGTGTLKSVAEKVGYMYTVTTAGTFLSINLEVGDSIIFKNDVAAETAPVASDLIFVQGTVSVNNNNPSLGWNNTYIVGTVEGVNLQVTMPSNPNTDTSVTSSANHYTPETLTTTGDIDATLSGSAGEYVIDTEYTVLTGVKANTDGKGHVTGITYTAQKVKDTNTTYTSQSASEGGTDVSLVTTGEKYNWNNKQTKVSALGSTTKPVYTSADGTFDACDDYAGGTAVTLNGTSKSGDSAGFYAPTSAGANGQILVSNGGGEPSWVNNTDTNSATLQISDAANKRVNTAETPSSYLQFTSGTNKFTVSDGTNQFDVDITPSIANNVTGSGLTADNIVVGNGNSTVKTSGKTIVTSLGSDDTTIPTSKAVQDAIDALPEPMVFKGTLGTGGTISSLPEASSSNEGFTYKVITNGTYAEQTAKIGDLFISNGTAWNLVPSGDEPSGTVTNIATGTGLTGGPITTSGTISHADTSSQASVSNSGRTYIQSVTLDDMGHVTGLSSATETVVDTDRYVNSAAFADDSTSTPASPVKMTLTRAGSDSATVTANLPKVSSTSAGVAPKGAAVTTQSQSTKFLREDGTWAVPSYTPQSGGDVTGPSSSTDAHVAVFNGATGKVIKDSGFTIGKSVPSDAVFTDTPSVFYAVYGTTTYSDIDAAYTAGKYIVVSRALNGTTFYGLADKNTDGTYYFRTFSNANSTNYGCYITSSGTWAVNSYTYQSSVAKLGSTTQPVYTSAAGTFAACSTYAGGTAVTLNGSSKAASTASFYAPTSYGTSGYYLKANGSGSAPTWAAFPTIPSKMSDVASITVTAISADTSSSCSITGSGNTGKSQTIIYTNSSGSDKTVTVPTTYKTPDGAAIELTCPNGGYCEVNYLNISGTIYARGL